MLQGELHFWRVKEHRGFEQGPSSSCVNCAVVKLFPSLTLCFPSAKWRFGRFHLAMGKQKWEKHVRIIWHANCPLKWSHLPYNRNQVFYRFVLRVSGTEFSWDAPFLWWQLSLCRLHQCLSKGILWELCIKNKIFFTLISKLFLLLKDSYRCPSAQANLTSHIHLVIHLFNKYSLRTYYI